MQPPSTEISLAEFQRDPDEVLRRVYCGEVFVITDNGVPIGTLPPGDTLTHKDIAMAALKTAPAVDYAQFRKDIDEYIDQDPSPRGNTPEPIDP